MSDRYGIPSFDWRSIVSNNTNSPNNMDWGQMFGAGNGGGNPPMQFPGFGGTDNYGLQFNTGNAGNPQGAFFEQNPYGNITADPGQEPGFFDKMENWAGEHKNAISLGTKTVGALGGLAQYYMGWKSFQDSMRNSKMNRQGMMNDFNSQSQAYNNESMARWHAAASRNGGSAWGHDSADSYAAATNIQDWNTQNKNRKG